MSELRVRFVATRFNLPLEQTVQCWVNDISEGR